MKLIRIKNRNILKALFVILTLILICGAKSVYSQEIAKLNQYLSYPTPNSKPQLFKLETTLEHFAAERIAISPDGREIIYSEVKSYYPTKSSRTKRYQFNNGKWNGPEVLFEELLSPALSVKGDTLFLENGNNQSFISIKSGNNWTTPIPFLSKLDIAHYAQTTTKKKTYISSRADNSIGLSDWCLVSFKDGDVKATSLGIPINTKYDNFDFFVSKDESFMIVTTPSGLAISFAKPDNKWETPVNLGKEINFGLGMWGPYISDDGKYLFYSTGTKSDYSDVGVYWVQIDNLIDSLKNNISKK